MPGKPWWLGLPVLASDHWPCPEADPDGKAVADRVPTAILGHPEVGIRVV